MIKRRLLACYVFFALAILLLIYSLNSMYMERYEISSESHVQNPFQVPDPFPKGKPDFRKKPEEEQKHQDEQAKQEEEKKKEEAKQKQEEKEQQRKAKETEDAERKAQEEAEAKKLKESEAQKEKEKADAQKKEEDDKKAQAESDKEAAKEEKKETHDNEPLIEELIADGTTELTAEELAEPIEKHVANRKKRYLAWMKKFRLMSNNDKKTVSSRLQGRFLGMEHKELKTFKEKIAFTDNEKVDGKVQPAGKKVVMLTATDGQGNSEIQNVLAMALENRKEYADYHGYTDYFVNLTKFAEPNRHPVWDKINAIREAFDVHPEAEWIWWIDTDIIIMNPELDLAEHILSKRALTERITYGRPLRNPESNFHNGVYMRKGEVNIDNIDLVICQDFFGLNAGSFFIRRSQFTDMLLDLWDDPMYIKAEFVRREQDALMHLFLNHENVQQHVGLVPQRLLNSYQDKPEWVWSFKDGDFVIHFAGCNTRGRCNEVWQQNWVKRGRVPEAYRVTPSVGDGITVSEKKSEAA